MSDSGVSSGKTIALTGSTGFIGRFLLEDLMRRGYKLRILLRKPVDIPLNAASAVIGDLTKPQNMAEALKGVDAVIHSAGLAHAASGLPEADYRAINTDATANLAQSAERAGVRRFIFLSSIRAQTGPTADNIVTDHDTPNPTDAYGRSKLAAEQALAETTIDWVALRPVLVYGSGVKGNMAELIKLARSGWLLPFGSLRARRSLLSIENLSDAIDLILHTETPLRRSMIVADDDLMSVGDMIRCLRKGIGRNAGLLPFPETLIRMGCGLIGKSEAFERVSGSLAVRADALKELGWQPPITTEHGLAALMRQKEASS